MTKPQHQHDSTDRMLLLLTNGWEITEVEVRTLKCIVLLPRKERQNLGRGCFSKHRLVKKKIQYSCVSNEVSIERELLI